MNLLSDPLTPGSIQMGCEFAFELYPSCQFGMIDNPDRQFRNGSVWTQTRTGNDDPEPLLTLPIVQSILIIPVSPCTHHRLVHFCHPFISVPLP